jgi:integrase
MGLTISDKCDLARMQPIDERQHWVARGIIEYFLRNNVKNSGKLTNQAIYTILAKRGNQAGVKHFRPHDLRRTFVCSLLDSGADIATVAKMAGHASVNTTARYDRRPEETKRKAASLLHIPYTARVTTLA